MIEDQGEKQIKAIEKRIKKQLLDKVKNQSPLCFQKIF